MKSCLTQEQRSLIQQLPGLAGVKSKNLTFEAINDESVKLLGFNSHQDIYGITDYDIKCDAVNFAEQFRAIDAEVLTGKVICSIDIMHYCDRGLTAVFSTKKPFYDADNNIIGVLCSGTLANNSALLKFSNILSEGIINKKAKISTGIIKVTTEDYFGEIKLSLKHQEVLFYLLRQKTYKEISLILNKSHRTVEDQVKKIIHKFNVPSRSALIEKAIEMGYREHIPETLLPFKPGITVLD